MVELRSVVPEPTEQSSPYWRSAGEHTLSFLRCGNCGRWIHYVKRQCPHCASTKLSWTPCSGGGTLYSYSILYRASSAAFKEKAPYVLAVIELEEGVKTMSHLVDCEFALIRVGMDVEAVFEKLDEGRAVPYFRPAPRI